MAKFDKKSFNPQAFAKYMETVPKSRLNALIKANIFKSNEDIKNMFSSQTGSAYGIIPMYGRLTGTPANYDGVTAYGDEKSLNTFERGVVVFGRKEKFAEKDFSYDITSKVDFMSQVGTQLGDYWDSANEDTLISIIKGIFASTTSAGKEFASKHTFDITKETVSKVSTTTLNNAIQKACGDRKAKFALVVMNSAVATELENQKLLTYLKENDANGLERDLNLATWNGKLVLVDDSITTETITSETGEGEQKVTTTTTNYITYVLGNGMFDYEDIGARVPYEMDRDADNDKDVLYSRERLVIAPYGFSYKKAKQVSSSPTDAELADGANWDLASDGSGNYFNHKEIAIAKIVSLG